MEEQNIHEEQNLQEEKAVQDEKSIKEEKNKELEDIKKQINVLKGKVSTLESQKRKIEKEAEEAVGKIIYEGKNEIERSHSEILKEAEHRLKAKEKEKEEERKKNLNRVVEENTKQTKENIVYLKNHIKNILEENNLPSFVNSNIYMGIWYPTNIVEWLTGFIAMVIVLLIPTIISFGMAKESLVKAFPNFVIRGIVIAFIYFAFIFVAGLIWLSIDKLTKQKIEVLKEIKEFRKNIAEDNKEIEKITKNTAKEMTDDKFDYTKLDREIEAVKIEVENYRKKKEDAINYFENTTKEEIKNKAKNEVEKQTKPIIKQIDELKKEIEDMQEKYNEKLLKAESY